MPRFSPVRWAAFFWGLATLFPIGLNYAAFVLLTTALLLDRQTWSERFARLRQSPNWWPAWAFLGWGALILALGPHYAETPSNAWHALRIVLVLWAVLALAREEATWALRGFGLGLGAAALIVLAGQLRPLPPFVLWDSLLVYQGNKSVADALLAALAATTLILCLPIFRGKRRAAACVLILALLALLAWALPSRTAWLIILAAGGAGLLHQARTRRYRHVLVPAAVFVLALGAAIQLSPLGQRIQQGAQEWGQGGVAQTAVQSGSVSMRHLMYGETARMVIERPFAGWGIGAWNQKWRERVPPDFAALSNMPHNDFLWIGAQAGMPAMLLLLGLVAAGLPRAWRRRDLAGCLGAVAIVAMLVALATSSALRDATMGLTLWFIVLVYQRIALEEPSAWE